VGQIELEHAQAKQHLSGSAVAQLSAPSDPLASRYDERLAEAVIGQRERRPPEAGQPDQRPACNRSSGLERRISGPLPFH
jgi:hypothetical protein